MSRLEAQPNRRAEFMKPLGLSAHALALALRVLAHPDR
jgi:hypothetical protein